MKLIERRSEKKSGLMRKRVRVRRRILEGTGVQVGVLEIISLCLGGVHRFEEGGDVISLICRPVGGGPGWEVEWFEFCLL